MKKEMYYVNQYVLIMIFQYFMFEYVNFYNVYGVLLIVLL